MVLGFETDSQLDFENVLGYERGKRFPRIKLRSYSAHQQKLTQKLRRNIKGREAGVEPAMITTLMLRIQLCPSLHDYPVSS